MVNITELLKQRDQFYSQIRTLNEQIENYYCDDSIMKVGDLYYDDDYFYLVLKKLPSKATVLCYSKYEVLEIRTENIYYVDMLYFTKVEADSNTLEDITNQLLNIKNGKEL